MLQRSLSEHSAGCFFGSDLLSAKLWQFMQQPVGVHDTLAWEELQNTCYQLLVESVDKRYPRRYRLNDINQLMQKLCDGDLFVKPDLPWLGELFDRLMRRNGDVICYRETEVQGYVRLAAELDPTLLVAWHLSTWLESNESPSAKDIQRIVTGQNSFFAPQGNPTLPFAEGHAHYGGLTPDSAILDHYLLSSSLLQIHRDEHPPFWHQQQTIILKDLLLRLRHILCFLLSDQIEKNEELASPEKTNEVLYPWSVKWNCSINFLDNLISPPRLPDWILMSQNHANDVVGSPGWLRGQFAKEMLSDGSDRWLWLQLYFSRCYRFPTTSPRIRVAILCWFQTLNDFRRRLIMDGQGLTRFVRDYSSGPLNRGKPIVKDSVKQVLAFNGDVAEIKSKPTTFSPNFAVGISNELVNYTRNILPQPPYIFGEHEIIPDAQALIYIQMLERWHFCGHFSRTALGSKPGLMPMPDMTKLWKETRHLTRKIDNTASWNKAEFMLGHVNPNFHFQPSRWFRGLDVAGDENHIHIEWFSPVIRWLRRGFIKRPDTERASIGFHLSIHAGEDYAHPASGMRHIDETVHFCEMRDGDRLGHALALGIEPAWWIERQGEMVLRVDEHIDNLVWLWHYSVTLSGKLPLAQQVQSSLERRILRFFPFTRWNVTPNLMEPEVGAGLNNYEKQDPEMLFRAWLLRRNCYYQFNQAQAITPFQPEERCVLPDLSELNSGSQVAELYFNRHRHIKAGTELPLVIVRSGDTWQAQKSHLQGVGTVHMKKSSQILEDVETPEEQEFMLALQDYLLDQYDRMGLIIETNPTSNVYIARFNKHSEHPIFRWNPPDESVLLAGEKYNRWGLRRGPIRVLVNTDDPGIMPTTLRTEFLLLREAAIELGISRTAAERWLEQLRQYGIEQFYRNHQPVFEFC